MNTNNFATNTTFARITFEGDNYNIYGNPVTLTNGITALAGANGNLFRPNIRIAARPMGISGPAVALELTILGNIDLNGFNLDLDCAADLHCAGRIIGTGNVTKRGSGRAVFDGIAANTYIGDTTVVGGILELSKFIIFNPGNIRSPRIAVPGNLIVGDGGSSAIGHIVSCQLHNQIATSAEVTVFPTGELNLNGYDNTIQSLTLNGGHVGTGAGTL